jgi:ribonuclease HI
MPEWIHTLTVDASYDKATRVTGVGVVIQERVGASGHGPILERVAEAHSGVAPGAGELFAVLRALEIAMHHGFTRIKIRSDYNAMRRDLRNRHRAHDATCNDLQRKVLELARRLVWVDFGYVPRRKNQIAHGLARKGRLIAWCIEEEPSPSAVAAAALNPWVEKDADQCASHPKR